MGGLSPRPGELGPQHRAEHVGLFVAAVGVFPRQGEQLRAGGGGPRLASSTPRLTSNQYCRFQANSRRARCRQSSSAGSAACDPLVVGAVAEPLADEDADHRVHRVEEPHQEGGAPAPPRPETGSRSAPAAPPPPGHEGHGETRETGSGLLRAADSKLIEIPLIWKKKRPRCGRAWRMAAAILCHYQQPPQRVAGASKSVHWKPIQRQYKDLTCLILTGK